MIPLLNGVEHVTTLRNRYASVAPAVIRVAATRVGPGEIQHNSPFVEVDLASCTVPRDVLEDVAGILAGAGVRSEVVSDEAGMLWTKLALLAPFALLTTRYRESIGDVRSARREELLALVAEVADVARASAGIETADKAMRFYESFPAAARSSMQVDAEAGRPLETEAIAGAVVRAADEHGVAVPITRSLYAWLADKQVVGG